MNRCTDSHGACEGCLCSANTTIDHKKWCRHCASDTETRDLFQEISHAGTSEGSASHEGRNWVLIGRKPGYTTGTPLTLVCSQWPVYDGSCISVCDGASKPSPLETSPLGMGASRAPSCISGERGKHGVGTWVPSTPRGEMRLGSQRNSVPSAVAVATCAPRSPDVRSADEGVVDVGAAGRRQH